MRSLLISPHFPRQITAIVDMLGHSNTHMIVRHYAAAIEGKALEVDDNINLY